MAPPTTTPKIEELRFRLKTDPKNRLFYVLAEELRRIGQFGEAEQVLHSGLTHHPTYLSAYVSLGRVLREQKKDGEAVVALSKALQLDPGNVVAARLLADAYLAMGEKVEAIKKYKLVQALLPADEQLEAIISGLDRDLKGPVPVAAPEPEPLSESAESAESVESVESKSPSAEAPSGLPEALEPPTIETAAPVLYEIEGSLPSREPEPRQPTMEVPAPAPEEFAAFPTSPFAAQEDEETMRRRMQAEAFAAETPESAEQASHLGTPESVFAEEPAPAPLAGMPSPFAGEFTEAAESLEAETRAEAATADAEPMLAAHESSPFEEPAADYTAGAFEVEAPAGMHVERTPLEAEVPTAPEMPEAETAAAASMSEPDAADVFAPESEAPASANEDVTDTLTMADLYVRQGLVADARHIYENILQRDPGNEAVREKLAALGGGDAQPGNRRIARLEGWLAKVARREVSHV